MKTSLIFFFLKRRSKAVCGCILELEKRGSVLGLISVLIGYLKLSGLKHHLLPGIWECLLGGSHSRSFLGFQKCQPPLQWGEGLPETGGDFQAPSLCCGLGTLVPIPWASPRGCFLSSQHGSSPTAGVPREQGRKEVSSITLPWKTRLIFAIFYLWHRQTNPDTVWGGNVNTRRQAGIGVSLETGHHPGEQLALPCSWGEAMEWRALVLTRR